MPSEHVRRYAGRFLARRAWNQVLNAVFPEDRASCTLCFRPVSTEWLTDEAIRSVDGGQVVEIPSEMSVRLCLSCLQDASLTHLSLRSRKLSLRPIVPVVSAVEHDGFIRLAMRQWKYDGGLWWTSWFAKVAVAAADSIEHEPFDVVVPVPTTRDRFLKRGYNHTKLLADEVAHDLGLVTEQWLVRSGAPTHDGLTQSQTAKSAADRKQGLTGQFRTVTPVLPPRHVLLLDDVVTTGATLYACAEAILAAGVRQVSGVTVAHVV